jgi:hypothetical protein
MAPGADPQRTVSTEAIALLDPDDPFQIWRELQEPTDDHVTHPGTPKSERAASAPTVADLEALADLDDPRLVLSDGYVGLDRRRPGRWRSLSRVTYLPRRTLFRLDVLIVLAVVAVITGAVLLVTTRPSPAPRPDVTVAALPTNPLGALPRSAAVATTVPTTTVPTTTVPTTTVPTTTVPIIAAPPVPAAPVVDPSSPQSMGAAALALVRYPWQQLPGYSIQFLPISDAPSPGLYGNTNFTWGQPGGASTIYVYPGETVDRVAGITAFEIGHEVDAAFVEPQEGHNQIESILGIHPANWAPECDCAEQSYLSGWFAAAFSDYWSPGVGAWSTLAPPPTGATLDAVLPWLDPRVP